MKVNVYSGYYEKYVTPKKLGKGYNLDYTDELKYVVFDTEDEWNNGKNSEEAVVWDKDIMDYVIKYSSNPWMFEDEEPEEDENGDISYGNMFIFSDMTSKMVESKQISRKRNLIYENTNIPIGKRTDTFEYKGYGKKYKIYLCLEEYYYGGIAVLAETSRGEPFADISINLPGVPLEDNEIFINDYISDDLCDKLVSLGILKETDETQEYNFGIYRKYIVNFDKFNR